MAKSRFFSTAESPRNLVQRIGKQTLKEELELMLLIRQFELRGEAAYQQGEVGGFYHAYSGEEAIQTAVVRIFGKKNWFVGFYRCHALALLLGATPKELMCELYGRANGNAKGRGGSMHLYTDRMLGGFAIVGGQLPIAAGAAFSLKYQKKKDEVALCFLGEGAVAQGAFHEALNLASLWDLPVVFIIENNQWGMGTHVSKALACHEGIAEKQAPSYNIKSYTLNGMDYLDCYVGFEAIKQEILKNKKPLLVECLCERFKGHSISDPALYRSKDELKKAQENDPIVRLKSQLKLSDDEFKVLEKAAKERVIEAMEFAASSAWPSPATLEEGVYAP